MINTQTLFLRFFVLSLLLGAILGQGGIYDQLTEGNQPAGTEINTDYQDNNLLNLEDRNTWTASQKNTQFQTEFTIGSATDMGNILWNVLISAINPWSISTELGRNGLEIIIIMGINALRTMLSLLAGIEAYMLWKNRKVS